MTKDDLAKMCMEEISPGVYQKKKSLPIKNPRTESFGDNTSIKIVMLDFGAKEIKSISLTLFGEPMPKQSVRSFIAGKRIMHYQPAKMKERVKDYQEQILKQLPEGFKRFEEEVHITKLHFVFAPLKGFSKAKMDRIKAGEIIYKNTRPDLPDNLKKLVNDSMSEIVYKDDGIIVSEDNVKKYYGTGGMILIEMEGY